LHLKEAVKGQSHIAQVAHKGLAKLYLDTGRLNDAANELTIICKDDPKLYTHLVEIHRRLGMTNQAETDATMGLRHFEELLAKNPTNTEAQLYVAHFLADLNRFDEAVARIRPNISTDPLCRAELRTCLQSAF
jgi:thioredoxin-like negative regulator of GroEL